MKAPAALGIAAAFSLLVISPTASAQTLPNYGYEWATITHAGNRPANALEAPFLHPPVSNPALKVGRVDYVYRADPEISSGRAYVLVPKEVSQGLFRR